MTTTFRQKGITLQELVITIAVMGILMAVAVPSFQGMIERNRLRGAAEGLYADLQFAKSEAVKRNCSVSVTPLAGSTWSYTLAVVAGGTCTADSLKTVSSADFPNVTLAAAGTLTFQPLRGTATGGTFSFSAGSEQVNVVLSGLGRARICSQAGNIYKAC